MMDKKEQGKKSRAAGNRFELKVRKDLEDQGWIVDKWSNNVEFTDAEWHGKLPNWFGKLVKVRNMFLGPGRPMMLGAGFPDFICFRQHKEPYYLDNEDGYLFGVIGVESKMTGQLDKQEKEKVKWLIDNKIFSKILIAQKGEKRGEIIYKEFK